MTTNEQRHLVILKQGQDGLFDFQRENNMIDEELAIQVERARMMDRRRHELVVGTALLIVTIFTAATVSLSIVFGLGGQFPHKDPIPATDSYEAPILPESTRGDMHKDRMPNLNISESSTQSDAPENLRQQFGDWKPLQSWTLGGYEKVHTDFDPSGKRLSVAYQRHVFNKPGLIEVYEWNDNHQEWILLAFSQDVYVNYGIQMTSSTSIWVGEGSSSLPGIQHLLLVEPVDGQPILKKGAHIVAEDSNGFNFEVQEDEDEATVVMGYPMWTPDGNAANPVWGLGIVKIVRVLLSSPSSKTEIVKAAQTLYQGTYNNTWMGESVAISQNRVAVAGVSDNAEYPDEGPPSSAVVAQIINASNENFSSVIGNFTFYSTPNTHFQFTRVALLDNVLAVLCSFPTIQVHMFRYSEDKNTWKFMGRSNPVISLTDPILNGNQVHIKLWKGGRLAIGGTGFDGPGYVATYQYKESSQMWIQMGQPLVSGNTKDDFAQGMAFAGDFLAYSTKDSKYGDGNVTIFIDQYTESFS